jgi:hypothetical protein
VHNHGAVVDVDVRNSDVVYSAVVIEGPAVPVATFIAFTKIPVAVINSAIEANMRTPIAGMPEISATVPSPITRGP